MKLISFIYNGIRHAGIVNTSDATVQALTLGPRGREAGALALIEHLANGEPMPEPNGPALALSAVRIEAPIPRPRRNIFCIGKNYRDHVLEVARSGVLHQAGAQSDIPTHPIVFSKVPESVIGNGDAIRIIPTVSTMVDYEAEVAVIIGRGGKAIRAADAMKHVFGYTVLNDVSARDWQNRHKQWHLGKSFDTFCPMGPWIVSADEVDGSDLGIRCYVNGELRQNSRTSQMIFNIPALIETLSAGITLHPGDIIATGTPDGVGIGFKPPRYLNAGDTIRIEVDDIGVLENPVR